MNYHAGNTKEYVSGTPKGERVVLLHGIFKTSRSMAPVTKMLSREGYETLSVDYASTTASLDSIADTLRATILHDAFWEQSAAPVHFVTHSMGGLVIRRFLHKFKDTLPVGKIGRVVMIAPPNGGSEIADFVHQWPLYSRLYGPAGMELTTIAQGLPRDDVYYDLGIIAGTNKWLYLLSSLLIKGPNDGRVSVARTKYNGMKDHASVRGTHPFMMMRRDTKAQTIYFLKHGVFKHGQ